MTSPLLSLPAETVAAIFESVESLTDTLALSETCRNLQQIWLTYRVSILRQKVRNSFHPANLLDAITVCQVSHLPQLWDIRSEEFHREQARWFQRYSYHHRRQYDLQPRALPYDLRSLGRLWRLCDLIDEFIVDFKTESFSYARILLEPIGHTVRFRQRLSESETLRLQRALLRMELYRRFFPNVQLSNPFALRRMKRARHSRSSYSQEYNEARFVDNVSFFELYTPWEREELFSVYEHLQQAIRAMSTSLKPLLDKARQEWGKKDLTYHERATADCVGYDPDSMSPAEKKEWLDIAMTIALKAFQLDNTFSLLTYGVDDYFYDASRGLRILSGRGLPLMRWLKNISPEKRLAIFLQANIAQSWDAPEDALRVKRIRTLFSKAYRRGSHIDILNHSTKFQHSLPNRGWCWISERSAHHFTKPNLINNFRALRRLGYVFWDRERLEYEWGLCKSGLDDSMFRYCLEASVLHAMVPSPYSGGPGSANTDIWIPVILPSEEDLDRYRKSSDLSELWTGALGRFRAYRRWF